MTSADKTNSNDRGVRIGGSANASIIVTGDRNILFTRLEKVTLPPSEGVDVARELAALRRALSGVTLDDETAHMLKRAVGALEEAASTPEPNKDEVGEALDRALGVAGKSAKFLEHLDVIRRHLLPIVAWLGPKWASLLSLVGLTL